MVTKEICVHDKCCGCEACAQACPVGCISLAEDGEGFLAPRIDVERCLDCGKCRRVCPVLTPGRSRRPSNGYAFRTRDVALLARTSSGGFFSFAAERVLSAGGTVYGARFNDGNSVVHGRIDSISQLDCLRRSKYVQSHIGTSYIDCRNDLEDGRQVLFCGTPCQISALLLFLGKEYSNLATMDFICHGVPSPGVFRNYLAELARANGVGVEEIRNLNFRAKDYGFQFPYSFAFEIGTRRIVETPRGNLFLRSFLADLFLRRSCHSCVWKNYSSGADYTVCDFWGAGKTLKAFPKASLPGISQVFVFKDRLRLFPVDNGCADSCEFDVWKSAARPMFSMRPVPRTPRRRKFFEKLKQGDSLGSVVDSLEVMSIWELAVRFPRMFIGRLIRKAGLK